MRGDQDPQKLFFSYVAQEDRIPEDHPLRKLRAMVDPILKELSPTFNKLYAEGGRPSIPPEYLLRALLLQILYTIRSERLLIEQLNYNLLFRWFVGLSMDDKCGITRPSARTGTGCWKGISPRPSWPRCWLWPVRMSS